MAYKGGNPGYPQQQPPPPAGYAPPPYPGPAYPQQGATNTVIIQQQQPVVVGKSSRGLFGNMMREVDKIGHSIGREADRAANAIDRSLQTTASSTVLNLFQTGNVIQLVSRANGGCLQILQGASGLVVDGRGPQGAPHATWTIVNEGNNQVRLHNNNNFLAIVNGNTLVMSMLPGMMHGVETKFQLIQVGQFVYLESMKERGRHIGILPNGDLKSALATGKEMHSQFGVKLLYSPYSQTTVTTVTTKR